MSNKIHQIIKDVIDIEIDAIKQLHAILYSPQYCELVDKINSNKGRVVVSGIGKSGHICSKFCASLSSTGTPSYFVHPSEAAHGDLGMICENDIVILVSNSGNSSELIPIINYVNSNNIYTVGITSNSDSLFTKMLSSIIFMPKVTEACSLGMVPTSSTTTLLTALDTIVIVLMYLKRFNYQSFHQLHPGGAIGNSLSSVRDIIIQGDELAIVDCQDTVDTVILEITKKCLGCAVVMEENNIFGIITDGDLRRVFNKHGCDSLTLCAKDIATCKYLFIDQESDLRHAKSIMEKHKVNILVVLDDNNNFVGLVNMHTVIKFNA